MKKWIYLLLLFLSIQSLSFSQNNLNIDPDLLPFLDTSLAPFYHGVASGDPTEHSVVIWTKVTLNTTIKEAAVVWEIATDSTFRKLIHRGATLTNKNSDFTVKERVFNLKPNKTYYYRFIYNGKSSIRGTTKTLPKTFESYQIAFASCSNYEWGYFNNYRFIAEDNDIDLVVHLGDYIYEYGTGTYGNTAIDRKNVPSHELITLADYRTRYSLYRLDKDLIKLHQLKPMITTWDDHEIANDAYTNGAGNHQSNEGDYITRKNAATKAYYEWLPISPKENEPLYRSFSIGSQVDLIVLDTRIAERTKQVDSMNVSNYHDSTRTILGKKQFDWLTKNLSQKHTWKIVCNQVPVGPMYDPTPDKKGKYMDGWDGYPFEKEKLIHYLEDHHIQNTVFVTGDFHKAIAMETDLNGTKETNDNVAVEFIVSSITSANDDEFITKDKAHKKKELYLKNNPNMLYCNNTEHGYLVLKILHDEIEADFIDATTIKERKATKYINKSFSVHSGMSVLIER